MSKLNEQMNNLRASIDKAAIILRDPRELIPNPDNCHTHSEFQINQIIGSMKEFRWTLPVAVDEKGVLLAGHGRVLAALKLGLEKIPTMIFDHMSNEQKEAYTLADNKINENAGWDFELLKVKLEELDNLDFDIDIIGFSNQEIERILDDERDQNDTIDDEHAGEKSAFRIECTTLDQLDEVKQFFSSKGKKSITYEQFARTVK